MADSTDANLAAARDRVRMRCLKTVLDAERDMAARSDAPSVENLPHVRSRARLEIIVAVLLALGISGITLVGNFLVFNRILHWTF